LVAHDQIEISQQVLRDVHGRWVAFEFFIPVDSHRGLVGWIVHQPAIRLRRSDKARSALRRVIGYPTGKSRQMLVKRSTQKHSCCHVGQIIFTTPAILSHQRALAIVADVGQVAVDAAARQTTGCSVR
jgi:hypothetical protein